MIDRNLNQLWRVVVLRIFSAHLALVLMMTTRLISVPISKSFDLYVVKKIKLDKNYVKLSSLQVEPRRESKSTAEESVSFYKNKQCIY